MGFKALKARGSLKADIFLQFGLGSIHGQATKVVDTGNDLEVVSMEKEEEKKEEKRKEEEEMEDEEEEGGQKEEQ